MSDDEGTELLLHHAGLEKNAVNLEYAKRIIQELGGLALAIDQAATYIGSGHVPLRTFSEMYKKRRAAILKHVRGRWSNHSPRLNPMKNTRNTICLNVTVPKDAIRPDVL